MPRIAHRTRCAWALAVAALAALFLCAEAEAGRPRTDTATVWYPGPCASDASEIEIATCGTDPEGGLACAPVDRTVPGACDSVSPDWQASGLRYRCVDPSGLGPWRAPETPALFALRDVCGLTGPAVSVRGLPVDLRGAAPQAAALVDLIADPAPRIETVRVILGVSDVDPSDEGAFAVSARIDGRTVFQGPVALFGGPQADGCAPEAPCVLVYDTPASWWAEGEQSVVFVREAGDGYRIDALGLVR